MVRKVSVVLRGHTPSGFFDCGAHGEAVSASAQDDNPIAIVNTSGFGGEGLAAGASGVGGVSVEADDEGPGGCFAEGAVGALGLA